MSNVSFLESTGPLFWDLELTQFFNFFNELQHLTASDTCSCILGAKDITDLTPYVNSKTSLIMFASTSFFTLKILVAKTCRLLVLGLIPVEDCLCDCLVFCYESSKRGDNH